MNIENALKNMGKEDRELVKEYLAEYRRTGNTEYALKAIEIVKNFDDDEALELKKTLKL